MAKSYFAILGVTSSATPEEIRSAYRRLAKAYHPDCYPGDDRHFRQVQEAYMVLGNPARRRDYEESLHSVPVQPRRPVGRPADPQPEPLVPEDRPLDFGEISPVRSFETYSPSRDEVFDWLWENFSGLRRAKSGRVRNLSMEVTLTPEQARRGGNARVMVPVRAVCPVCRGYGAIGFYECRRCAGEGAIAGEVPVAIAFPPGLSDDHAVVIPLERFGIRNLQLTVVFRPRGGEMT